MSKQYQLHGRTRGIALATAIALPVLLPLTVSSQAQDAEPLPVVGFYALGPRDTRMIHAEAFMQGMADLGYYDGWNVRYELVFSDANADLYAPNAAALAALAPRAIVSWGDNAAIILAEATTTVPLVSANADAALLPRQDNVLGMGNARGSAQEHMLLPLLHELLPEATTVGYLINAGQNTQPIIDVASGLGLTVVFAETGSAADAVPAFQSLVASGVDGVLVRGGARFVGTHDDIAAAARAAAIPTIYYARAQAPLGQGCEVELTCPAGGLTGLMSVGEDDYTNLRISSYIVDRLLRGEDPADIPLTEAPLLLRMNMAAANELGLSVPASILARATIINE